MVRDGGVPPRGGQPRESLTKTYTLASLRRIERGGEQEREGESKRRENIVSYSTEGEEEAK